MFCGNCGKEISGKNGVCEFCGAAFAGNGNTQESSKEPLSQSPLPSKVRGKKKILAVAAAVVCVAVGALAFAAFRLAGSPKQKVLIGAAKTVKAGIMGDTTLVGVLGLDQMIEEIQKGNTAQIFEMNYPEGGTGIRVQAFLDQKKGVSRTEISPTIRNMDLTEFILYKKENLLHFGLPDVLDDVYYVDLSNLQGEYSGSALDRLIQEETGMRLEHVLPGDMTAKETHSYLRSCQEELGALYDSMEVEKDGTETIRIGGKSQKCGKYHVVISGSSVKDLLSASLDYLEEQQGMYVFMGESLIDEYDTIYWLKKEVLPRLKFRDLDMTVCLDKKGRLVSLKGEWSVTAGGLPEPIKLEYEGTFTGGASPLDKIRGVLLISSDGQEYEFTFERDKQFQKKSSLKDHMDLTIVELYGNSTFTYPFSYEFSYNLTNGKWDVDLVKTDTGTQLLGEGKISDVKKGKELSITLDQMIDPWNNYYEGSYKLTALGKEGVSPLDGIEKGISLFDMSRSELVGVGEDLFEWMDRMSGDSYYGGSSVPEETTADEDD